MPVFGLWEEARLPRDNPHRHGGYRVRNCATKRVLQIKEKKISPWTNNSFVSLKSDSV